MIYDSLDRARAALAAAASDTAGDFGEEAVDSAWNDLVRAVAADCTRDVAEELMRVEGVTRDPMRCWCGLTLRPSESPTAREGALECPRSRPGAADVHDVYVAGDAG